MGGCAGCGTRTANGLPAGCKNNGACSTGGCGDKLDVYDWLSNVYYYEDVVRHPIVEVKFKGTRKEYFKNPFNVDLEIGDAVIVESQTSGWDLGYVALTGELVKLQMKKYRIHEDSEQVKKLLRKATEADFEKYDEGKGLEYETMLQARRLANTLNLTMKISDVEYQGDRTKATFFYTAEGRVDFRELIKVLAKEFKIKIEMRQIGLRQEAGRLGGIGSCGRELCCSTWLTDFHSVPTTAARYQNLFLNPLKLSGQCGRLKCCLNYELDVYVEALAEFPDENTILKTTKGSARVEKMDILKRIMWFRYMDANDGTFYPVEISQIKKIVDLNEEGVIPPDLDQFQAQQELPVKEVHEFKDTVGEDSVERFDQSRGRRGKQQQQGNKRQETNDRNNQRVTNSNQGENPNRNERNNDRNRPNNENRNRPNNNDRNRDNNDRNNPNKERQNPNQPRGNRPPGERQQNNANRKPERPQNPSGGRPGLGDLVNSPAAEASLIPDNSDTRNQASRPPRNNDRGNRNRPQGEGRPQGDRPQNQQRNQPPRDNENQGENTGENQNSTGENSNRNPNPNRNRNNRNNRNRPRPAQGGENSGEQAKPESPRNDE